MVVVVGMFFIDLFFFTIVFGGEEKNDGFVNWKLDGDAM